MVNFENKINYLVDYLTSNSNQIYDNLSIVVEGEKEDVAFYLPCIEISATVNFVNQTAVSNTKIPAIKVTFLVNASSQISNFKSTTLAFDIALKLYYVLINNKHLRIMYFEDMERVTKIDQYGEIKNLEFATVSISMVMVL